jgi:hypothetical protein
MPDNGFGLLERTGTDVIGNRLGLAVKAAACRAPLAPV